MTEDQDLMDVPMTAAEMAAFVTAATVKTTKIRMTPREWLSSGQLHIGSNGTPVWNSAGGVNTVTEASASSHYNAAINSDFFGVDATGVIVNSSSITWAPLAPTTRIADGAGAHAVLELVPALADRYGELVFWFAGGVNAGNSVTLVTIEIEEDNGAAACRPAYSYVGPVHPANVLGPFHVMTTNKNKNIACDDGGNGTWAASQYMTFWGFYRYIP